MNDDSRRQYDPDVSPNRYALFSWRIGREDVPIAPWSIHARRTAKFIPIGFLALTVGAFRWGADMSSPLLWLTITIMVLVPISAITLGARGYPMWLVRDRNDWTAYEYWVGKLALMSLPATAVVGPLLMAIA